MKNHKTLYHSTRSFIFLALFIFGSLPVTVSAVGSEDFLMRNGILFFNPGDSGCSTGSPVSSAGKSMGSGLEIPTLQGEENDEKIWNYLISEGLSEEQAAGIMGNIYQEAQFKPDLEEGNGIGYGIVQWSFERRTALEEKADELGVAVSDLGFQLAYMMSEMKNDPLVDFNGLFEKYNTSSDETVWDVLTRQKTVEDSTIVFHDGFERSGDYDNHGGIQHRIDYAKEMFEKFTGKSASGGSVAAGGECAGGLVSGNLTELVLAYAWPEYHDMTLGPVDPPPKPAYEAIATKLQDEGKWVGGGNSVPGDNAGYPAIDCGGFVSILLTQSGFEPNYNHGLGDGAGAVGTQHQWAKDNWESLGRGGTIDAADLRPGDVAFKDGDTHTFVYVGKIDGFESQYASASYGGRPYLDVPSWRSPMSASLTAENVAQTNYLWYGKR